MMTGRRLTWSIRPLAPADVLDRRAAIGGVFRRAFRPAPYSKLESEFVAFATLLPEATRRPGFRCFVAEAGTGRRLAGFTYGYTALRSQGWYRFAAGHPTFDTLAPWLDASFYLAEMAVDPAFWGRGIGGALHDTIMRDLPYARAVLSTMAAETTARRLYLGRGWQTLIDRLDIAGIPRPYCIMGRTLPMEADR